MVDAPPIHDEPYEVYLEHGEDSHEWRIIVRRRASSHLAAYEYMIAPNCWRICETAEPLCSVPCEVWSAIEVLYKAQAVSAIATEVAAVFAAARDELSG